MSAYVVSRAQITVMLEYGLRDGRNRGDLRWFERNPVLVPHAEWDYVQQVRYLTRDTADRVGQMLWDENVRSVCYRYPSDSIDNLPGSYAGEQPEWLTPYVYAPVLGRPVPSPQRMMGVIRSYEYQACEHPDWRASEAWEFCDSLMQRAVGEVAEGWSWDEREAATGGSLWR